MTMRIVFMGSDAIACPTLHKLTGFPDGEMTAVFTAPDRSKGRRRKLTPCPVKETALELNLPVFSPEKIGSPEVVDHLRGLAPDLIVVFAYGQYLPSAITKVPPLGCINIHPSLLPKYRGASPIQYTLLNGDALGGITVLYVSSKMDAGDIICQREISIEDEDTAGTLADRMSLEGADLLMEAIAHIRDGTAVSIPQDESAVVEVGKLSKADGRMPWHQSARELRNRVRALNPWPGCFCEAPVELPGPLKILAARVESGKGEPGEVLEVRGAGPLVAAGHEALRLTRVQPPGKKPMPGDAFLRGHALKPGMKFT